MAAKAALVEEIKQLQRSSPELKQEWWDFCDKEQGGIRDPSRHDEGVLQAFLDRVGDVVASTPAKKRGGGFANSGGGFGNKGAKNFFAEGPHAAFPPQMFMPFGFMPPAPQADLTTFIKMGQKSSAHWKSAWQAYCRAQGSTSYDPTRYDHDFMAGFIDYVGQCAEDQLSKGRLVTTRTRAASDSLDGPPSKRRALLDASNDEPGSKGDLVRRVKEFQRKNNESKELWWSFTDDKCGGIHDPARHDASILQEFVDMYGA